MINVALGYARDGGFESEGWWVIGANRCVDLIRTAIPARYLYLYAEDVFHKPVLTGTMNACVASGKFLIVGERDCWKRGNVEVPFVEIDTKSLESWTFILTTP